MSIRYSFITTALLGFFCSTRAHAEDLPDLIIDEKLLESSVVYELKNFKSKDCAVVEGAVDSIGKRKLLRFSVRTPNVGKADLVLGKPQLRPDLFMFSPCHGHYHFDGYALYELLNVNTQNQVIKGRKQAFCLEDYDKWDLSVGEGKYTCTNQGISVGWADTYGSYLTGQWLDITDITPGNYLLRVTVNPERALKESNYDNNQDTVAVTIPTKIH